MDMMLTLHFIKYFHVHLYAIILNISKNFGMKLNNIFHGFFLLLHSQQHVVFN